MSDTDTDNEESETERPDRPEYGFMGVVDELPAKPKRRSGSGRPSPYEKLLTRVAIEAPGQYVKIAEYSTRNGASNAANGLRRNDRTGIPNVVVETKKSKRTGEDIEVVTNWDFQARADEDTSVEKSYLFAKYLGDVNEIDASVLDDSGSEDDDDEDIEVEDADESTDESEPESDEDDDEDFDEDDFEDLDDDDFEEA